MKKILVMAFAVMLVVWTAGSAQATFWVPTESGVIDVNYLTYTGSGAYAIFDDSSVLGVTTDPYLLLDPTADTIFFVQNGSNWDLSSSVTGNTVSLTGNNTFQLAWMPSSDTAWYADTSYTFLSHGVYNVSWDVHYSTHVLSSSITQIDAAPVPVPPSAIMLLSGLLGLVG
ncbi:MAG: hypothetical protein KAW01_08285, partial [Deltaproteobacteria bacterium]|nr:hypothetical protein [Deltaproteobacteria bacterium]